ncbi:cytosine deaminase protein-like protein [Phyllosticta citrichinensis]
MAARLPGRPVSDLWDLSISDGRVASIEAHDPRAPRLSHLPGVLDASGCLLALSLCHAHIHLDKCFLLQDPKFADLEIEQGDFAEALALTQKAKLRFEEDDLLRRGRQLIEESIRYGVTAMRAFVEVDADVGFKCLDAGLKLKHEFEARCEVQICAFAQLPLFSGPDEGKTIRDLMSEAVVRDGVDVVGSTPYVETTLAMAKNVRWMAQLALEHDKFLDFHMDYHLKNEPPLVWEAIGIFDRENWDAELVKGKMITLGHCTRLTIFDADDWFEMGKAIGSLPMSFVGLPTSDLYMMRSNENVRGTLNIPELIKDHDLQAAIAVNNVGNAFTPQGSCDPLAVASLGIGVYQAGTREDAELLYECVSKRAKAAIGLPAGGIEVAEGDPADFVLLDSAGPEWRRRKRLAEVVYDPPEVRKTIKSGHITTR